MYAAQIKTGSGYYDILLHNVCEQKLRQGLWHYITGPATALSLYL